MEAPHFRQKCVLLNSSEKISFSAPQLPHLQTNDLRFLKDSHPGQCVGVVAMADLLLRLSGFFRVAETDNSLRQVRVSLATPATNVQEGNAPAPVPEELAPADLDRRGLVARKARHCPGFLVTPGEEGNGICITGEDVLIVSHAVIRVRGWFPKSLEHGPFRPSR